MRTSPAVLLLLLLASASAIAQAHPRDKDIPDADTRAWWHTTEFLSSDAMEGRDTGSPAYERAAAYVAARMKAAGLQPAGDHGTFLQTVPMHQVDVVATGTSFRVKRVSGDELPLAFLEEITTTPSLDAARAGTGPLVFRGYCGKDEMRGVENKFVLCFGTQRQGLPGAAERSRNAQEAGALGVISVDDPYFTIEPPRWPWAYARSVVLNDPAAAQNPARNATRRANWLAPMRLSAPAFTKLLAGTGHDAAAILKAGGAKQPLESFDLRATFSATLQLAEKEIHSPNILGVLAGADPALQGDLVVTAAHLDGYGYGTPVSGDRLYNGALDDAAYVALLLQYADDVKASVLPRPKRSILIAAFTGEEKGLLGSTWFVAHPTVPKARLVADINLDQLRPLFPLRILTVPGIDLTTLGDTARKVAANQGIELREDREAERGLLHRADNWPFLRAGIPAIGFVFGFDPDTDAERRYRQWYQVRYHRPQDDTTQPMDFNAAHAFNTFFYRLTDAIANAAERPKVLRQPS